MIWGSYGIVHIATLVLSVAIIVGLYFILKNRSEKTQTLVLFILSFSGIAALIYNLVTWGTPLEYLPFHMCSITAMLLPFAVITKNKIINNLLLFWCLGALLALLLNQSVAAANVPSWVFFFYYFPHTLEFGIPILMFALKLAKKDLRCLISTVSITMGIYTAVHLINVALNNYFIKNGLDTRVNYMFSSPDPANPVLTLMAKVVPFDYWYMYVAVPFIVLYLSLVYLPEIIALIKHKRHA